MTVDRAETACERAAVRAASSNLWNWACLLTGALAGGCGGSATASDAGEARSPDASADSHRADAPDSGLHAAIPLVDYLGGPIIASPKVVTVTYGADADPGADPKRAFAEAFDDAITSTPWWDDVRAGYCDNGTPRKCVGRGTSGGHVHLTDSPAAAYDDSPAGGSLRTLLQSYITSGLFPTPDSDTIYVVFFPRTSMITVDGYAVSCQQFGAYHASFEAALPGGGRAVVPYVIVPRCSSNDGDLTASVSHELIESATDPVDPDPAIGGNGYSMTTDTVWPVFGDGSEVADLCIWANESEAYTEGSYAVVRSWSNLAAAGGHDPCVPAPALATRPYFNVAPSAERVSLRVGQATTVDLDAFSDGPMPDWTVAAEDVSPTYAGTANAATFALDRTAVNDGTRLHLTIVMARAAPEAHPMFLMLISTSGTTIHRWPIAVTTPE